MKKTLIICIFAIAFFFRIYNLANVPPHPSLDEVSIGYNAYSILETGRDEYGTPFPYLLRAYDDYRPALYVYLVIPFVALLGLNEVAVRLPSVLLSLISLIGFYLLVRDLFKDKAIRVWGQKIDVAVISTAFLALSPLHIYISRLGHEVNLFFASFIIGLYLFFHTIQKGKYKLLPAAAVFLGISFSSYQSGKIVIPLMLLGLGMLYAGVLWKHRMSLFLSIIVGVLVISPAVLSLFQPESLIRFQGTSIFNEVEERMSTSAENVLKARQEGDKIGELLHNRRLLYATVPFNAFVSHLNPYWLFYNSGGEAFKAPQQGVLYLSDAVFITLGLYVLVFSSKQISLRNKLFLVLWISVGLIPAALTSGYPHAMRVFQVLPAIYVVMGVGAFWLLNKFPKRQVLIILAIIALFVLNALLFSRSYFHLFPRENAYQFQYGLIQSFSAVAELESQYDSIYVSNQGNLFQSYMFYLYATQKDPHQYLQDGGTVSGGFAESHHIGKYYFGEIRDVKEGSLVIMNPGEFQNGTILDTIEFPNGDDAIHIKEVSL